jgi:hypothetical protein
MKGVVLKREIGNGKGTTEKIGSQAAAVVGVDLLRGNLENGMKSRRVADVQVTAAAVATRRITNTNNLVRDAVNTKKKIMKPAA